MVALESEIALKVTEKRPLGGIDDLRGGGGLAGWRPSDRAGRRGQTHAIQRLAVGRLRDCHVTATGVVS
jgi:hypothetical protein